MSRIRILAGVLPELEGELRAHAMGQSDMSLVACARDGAQVVEHLRSTEVDAVVVELLLPRLDALGVLDYVAHMAPSRRPMVFVVTPTGKEPIVRMLLEAGADYCLLTPLDMDVLCSRIRQFASARAPSPQAQHVQSTQTVCLPDAEEGAGPTEATVASLISGLGVPSCINGYRYLCLAVSMVVHNEALLGAMTKVIYPTVARECGSTAARVERSIRHAVEVVWARGDQEQLNRLFAWRCRRQKPTNAEFIAVLADSLRELVQV